jgi:tetratricopeptide (TPR) repeat protein
MAIHSPYTSDMRKSKSTFSLFTLILSASVPCFSQTAPSPQQQVQEHTRKAQEYLRENRPDLAAPEFKAIVALEPNNADARGNLGVLLFFQGAYADAIPQLRAALKMQPSLWKIQALLGMAEKRTGDIHAATGDLEKAFPKVKEQKIRVDTGMELIDIYSKSSEMDKAAGIVSVLRELDPTNVEILYTAYRLYSDLADEARLSLIVVGPNAGRTHKMMAHELARQGNSPEAIANYREALKLEPNLPGLHFELAEMLKSSSTPDAPQQAELEYKASLAVNPFDEKSECRLGDLAAAKGDAASSREHYERALKLQPNDPEANIGLAKALMAMNQPEKALPLLEKAVKLDPTSAVAHFRLSTIYRQMGRTEDAKREIAEYQKYKDMKEKLRDVYRQMRLEPDKKVNEEEDARQQ